MNNLKRLKKNKDFQVVFKQGKSFANRQFVVYVLKQDSQPFSRLGLSVSKKMGNAVMRNHIKRYIKEMFRGMADKLGPGTDFIVISRRPVRTLSYQEMEKSLIHVLKKTGMLQAHEGTGR